METPTQADLELLRRIVGRMIPGSARYQLPGADDPAIFGEVAAMLRAGSVPVGALVQAATEDKLGDRTAAADQALFACLREADADAFAGLTLALAQCYYRDDRVMRALDMEPRPPFPKGYEVAEGDWSLLEPVKRRSPLWRPPS